MTFHVLERLFTGGFQGGKFVADGIPQDIRINTIVGMTKDVPYTANVMPRNVRSLNGSLLSQLDGRLADTREASFNRILPQRIASEITGTVQTGDMAFNAGDIVENILKSQCGIVRRHGSPHAPKPAATALCEPAKW